jgi:hypothetical protein
MKLYKLSNLVYRLIPVWAIGAVAIFFIDPESWVRVPLLIGLLVVALAGVTITAASHLHEQEVRRQMCAAEYEYYGLAAGVFGGDAGADSGGGGGDGGGGGGGD